MCKLSRWINRHIKTLADRGRALRAETYALYLACRDPRMPWYVKALAATVIAYALSPVDLIPDFIPVLGHLDDLVLVPLGVAWVLRMTPPEVMVEARAHARAAASQDGPEGWIAGLVVVLIWLSVISCTVTTYAP